MWSIGILVAMLVVMTLGLMYDNKFQSRVYRTHKDVQKHRKIAIIFAIVQFALAVTLIIIEL